MRYLKILGMTLVAMLTLGIAATSASALTLPDIHALTYPLHLNFEDNGKTGSKLVDSAGNKLEGKGLKLLTNITALTSLGTFEALFLNVENPNTKEKCKTAGDVLGEILLKGTFHIVPLNTNKEDGILFLFKEFKITCGAAEIVKVRGSAISTVNFEKKTESEEFTQLCGVLNGTIEEYLNDSGGKVKEVLLDEFGLGFNPAKEIVEGEVCATALNSGMFLILNR